MSDITRLLQSIGQGNPQATADLLPLIYDELQRLARQHMARERAEHTLQATALVHEVFLRLMGDGDTNFETRAHFFTCAAEAMRRILIEHARRKSALKHGGNRDRLTLHDEFPHITSPCDDVDDLLALNDALDLLADTDPENAKLVKLLYFTGLNLDQAAAALGIGRTTAYRRWVYARAWLFDAISGKTQKSPS